MGVRYQLRPSIKLRHLARQKIIDEKWLRGESGKAQSITPPIPPSRPPPLLPPPTIKPPLPQLHIDRIVRLTHPLPKLCARTHPRRISPLRHPFPKVGAAVPAWVERRERGDELAGRALGLGRGRFRVCGRHAVEERPRGAAEGFDVWWAVWGLGEGCVEGGAGGRW